MAFQTVFKRYELKYMITREQKAKIISAMEPHMIPDKYGRTTIRNIYFDTQSYRLIRHSIERPAYKEKLRIRSYGKATPDSTVFVELKKKYDHVVYKRRIPMSDTKALDWICGKQKCELCSQIVDEIDYFLEYYGTLHPTVFLSYEREAYYDRSHGDFRVTFDENILCRQDDLSLRSDAYGTSLLPQDCVLMEIKCAGGIPLWMTRILSEEQIYKTSFSKYGTAYKKMIFPELEDHILANTKEEHIYVRSII